MKKIIISTICLCLFTNVLCAAEDKLRSSYRGTVGTESAGISLEINDGEVNAQLFMFEDMVYQQLAGHITESKLRLKSDDYIVTAEFSDEDKLLGSISFRENTRNLDMYLSHQCKGGLNSKYAIAGFDNDKKLEEYVSEFKTNVLNNNKEAVAKMIALPLKANLADGTQIEIRSKDMFLDNYNEIFHHKFLHAFKDTIYRDMFAKHDGVLLSNEENNIWVWFSPTVQNNKTVIKARAVLSEL